MSNANSKKFTAVQGFDLATMPKNLEFPELETRMGKTWSDEKVYEYDTQSSGPRFVVDTPPPTVSGSLHVGHIFSYTQTDVIARYQRMLGKNVFYPMGWDDNGLPTERRVQNYFHIRCEPTAPYEPGLDLPPILSVMTDKEITEKKIPQKIFLEKTSLSTVIKLQFKMKKNSKSYFLGWGFQLTGSLNMQRSMTIAEKLLK